MSYDINIHDIFNSTIQNPESFSVSIVDLVDMPNVHNLLNIGCKDGSIALSLLNRNRSANIVAIDSDNDNIEIARIRYLDMMSWLHEYADTNFEGHIDFICMDMTQMPFHNKFDLVLSNQAIQHSPDPSLTYQQIYDSLEFGGSFISVQSSDLTFAGLHQNVQRAIHALGYDDYYPEKFTVDWYPSDVEVISLLQDVGFKNIGVTYQCSTISIAMISAIDFANNQLLQYRNENITDDMFSKIKEVFLDISARHGFDTRNCDLLIKATK